MRKPFSLALCGLAVVFAGSTFAVGEPKAVTAWTDSVGVQVERAVQFFGPSTQTEIKTQRTSFESAGNRSGTPRLQNPDADGKQAMLLVGLTIMGVIIKRRYGKGN